ncbi:unnamed protein product [Prunus armeniaca]|uniref:Uncharacterized protein n=1 Tax=Prunus armeniaca TaxID=36596 RepID=A0A6J5WCE3_PRUAR|nr:unnamed protein product [Prunus armeniaca]CAB4299390.1 unnamed protein product [Prunus armeniaca]
MGTSAHKRRRSPNMFNDALCLKQCVEQYLFPYRTQEPVIGSWPLSTLMTGRLRFETICLVPSADCGESFKFNKL